MNDAIRLGLCVPGESMPIESVRAYAALIMELCANREAIKLERLSQHLFASSMLPYARAKVCQLALEVDCTHLLLIDTDMTYPRDAAHRLLAHGRPFVAANATTRRPPVRWVAKDKAGDVIDSNRAGGLPRAWSCGLAFCLLGARVFAAIDTPQFDFEYGPNGWIGEDVYFCKRAIESGFAPMIDNELSPEIGHVGSMVYHGGHITPIDG